jgi:hypothetical protein
VEALKKNTLRKNVWNIILIVIVLIIVVAVYAILTNQSNAPQILTPDEVLGNPTSFLGKKIIVEGYYYHENFPDGKGVITTSIVLEGSTSTGHIQRLPVDHTAVNTTGLLQDKVKYRFEGQLIEESSPLIGTVMLNAENIRPV